MNINPVVREVVRTFEAVNRSILQFAQFTEKVARISILHGRLVDVTFSSSGVDTLALHKLGRKPQGWWAVKYEANASIWETASSSSYLTLQSDAGNHTMTLWVF